MDDLQSDVGLSAGATPLLAVGPLAAPEGLATDPSTRPGVTGQPGDDALDFDGETSFGFIEHAPGFELLQGTIALWVHPDDLDGTGIFVSKDEREADDGGHFLLGHDDDHLFLRFAEGDGGQNKAWITSAAYLDEGAWTHLAVSFSAEGGVVLYVDGVPVPDTAFIRVEGNEDSPSLHSEAYLFNNDKPFVLGADTARTEVTATPQDIAADRDELRCAFDGGIDDFVVAGGFSAADVLAPAQIAGLAGVQPAPASVTGTDGADTLDGSDGADSLYGAHGDDRLAGGDGADALDGGFGSDLLLGGAGDDLLISRSDAGEQRIGQLMVGQPTRGDAFEEVNTERLKLIGYESQPLVADDILIGGAGNDTFLINPEINAKRRFIVEHVNEDRTIDWAGVAGENDNLHDHWVDAVGIDVIGDFTSGEDRIAIVGHTVDPEITHKRIDSDGDGTEDDLISILTLISRQHGGGGAHTLDLVGQVVVFGDPVSEADLLVEDGATHGIVQTIDQIQDALYLQGTPKVSTLSDGSTFLGYDSRDDQGDPGEVVANPERFVTNPFLAEVEGQFGATNAQAVPLPAFLLDAGVVPELAEVVLSGDGSFAEIAPAAGIWGQGGTLLFGFVADRVGGDTQALLSQDARTFQDGGHLTVTFDTRGDLVVRYQSTEENVHLKTRDLDLVAGEQYTVAFTFSPDDAALYVDGTLADREELDPSFAPGMANNGESLILGASAVQRPTGTTDNLKDFFDGTIADVRLLDRPLSSAEVLQDSLGALEIAPVGGFADPGDGVVMI